MKALLVVASSVIAAALLTFPFGGARSVRAEDNAALAAARPDMVLISAAALDGLEQRVSYLEGVVASLTLASQHLTTYQLCISGDAGEETCITQPQLEALLAKEAYAAEARHPASRAADEGSPPAEEDIAVTTASNSAPKPTAVPDEISQPEPEATGSITTEYAPAVPE
jgi:hypothetical protein